MLPSLLSSIPPQSFTQSWPFACLITRGITGFTSITSQRAEVTISLIPGLRAAIGLDSWPRFTKLQALPDRPDVLSLVDQVKCTPEKAASQQMPQDPAFDEAGVEATSAYPYLSFKSGRKRLKFVELVLRLRCIA